MRERSNEEVIFTDALYKGIELCRSQLQITQNGVKDSEVHTIIEELLNGAGPGIHSIRELETNLNIEELFDTYANDRQQSTN